MRRQRRRPVYYTVISDNDGTVLAAYPIRKIPDRIMKRDGQRLDEDGVCKEFMGSRVRSCDVNDPGRTRFFDIMANRLNARRAVREIAVPEIKALRDEVTELRKQVRQLTEFLSRKQAD
ncbi:MAG: hypothetical protein IT442_09950 [Phycisphaeraceae bacterium]|nr:hypothetical protein [Phycisphaeraceae bacterium]